MQTSSLPRQHITHMPYLLCNGFFSTQTQESCNYDAFNARMWKYVCWKVA